MLFIADLGHVCMGVLQVKYMGFISCLNWSLESVLNICK